jgi:SulP family sulfate permease
VPAYVKILRIHGPFLFGTTEKLIDATRDLSAFPAIVVLRLRNMTALDATGLHSIEKLAQRLRASGKTLLLCGARDQPAKLIEGSALIEEIGRENILPNVDAALERARLLNASFDGVGPDLVDEMKRATA